MNYNEQIFKDDNKLNDEDTFVMLPETMAWKQTANNTSSVKTDAIFIEDGGTLDELDWKT